MRALLPQIVRATAMGTRKQREKQEGIWIAQAEMASAPAHPFYQKLNELLEGDPRHQTQGHSHPQGFRKRHRGPGRDKWIHECSAASAGNGSRGRCASLNR
jgi:hypothetical protein